MKQITLLFLIVTIWNLNAQDAISYGKVLNRIDGMETIDGSKFAPKVGFANLKSDQMIFSDKSSLTVVNSVIKVNGLVDASANCKLILLNSYIICKDYKGPASDRIIKTNYIKNCKISQMKFVKKLKGNPNIEIIDKSGTVIAKGFKEDISDKLIDTGVYDVRSKGNFYNSNVLLAGK